MNKTIRILSGTLALAVLSAISTGCACHSRGEARAMMQPLKTEVASDGYLMKNVYYAFDRYDLSALGKETLEKNAQWLNENRETTVRIEGHADERGSTQYNLALAKSRAITAADYLESLGVDRARIETISYGEARPADTRATEDAWARNRRVEFNALGDAARVTLQD
jgi:peptidoglycan-associated lipoprotein